MSNGGKFDWANSDKIWHKWEVLLAKIYDYRAVQANNDNWWLRVLSQLGKEGKITRGEVFAIFENRDDK